MAGPCETEPVWRIWSGVASAIALAGAVPAVPAAGAPAAVVRGMPVCTATDQRLTEVSGMVRTRDGYAVIDDGSDLSSHWRIFFLDDRCAVTRTVRYPSTPRDTEDMAQAPDGTLWVADIGDNRRNRQTVALWRLASGAPAPVLYRMSYPDGPHDAEALVLAGDGTPVIITKDIGTGYLYQPGTPLRAGATVPLRRVGSFDLPGSDTGNPFGFAGRLVITGGANAPDGSRVVLRTYADAYEFAVTGGDVVRAITTGTPRAIPLPDEPQGESIAYDRDGSSLLTMSEQTGPVVLRYPLPRPSPRPSVPATRAAAGKAAEAARARRSGPSMPLVAGAAGLTAIGLAALVAVGVLGRRGKSG
jgi:hypothetical protein